MATAFLARTLPFFKKSILKVVDHHDDGRFLDMLKKLFELLATNGLLQRCLRLFSILLDLLALILQVLLPETILTFLVHLHVLVSLKQFLQVFPLTNNF